MNMGEDDRYKPIKKYELEGNRDVSANLVGRTDSPRSGARGTYQIRHRKWDELESQRIIANVEARDTAQQLVTDMGRAMERHEERSPRARTVDEKNKARLTTSYEQWAANPRRWDYPGVDDPRTNRESSPSAGERMQQMHEDGNYSIGRAGPDEYEWRNLENDL